MNNKGFTLIELLVTVAIVALLFSIAVPLFKEFKDRAGEAQADSYSQQAVTSFISNLDEYDEFIEGKSGSAWIRNTSSRGWESSDPELTKEVVYPGLSDPPPKIRIIMS